MELRSFYYGVAELNADDVRWFPLAKEHHFGRAQRVIISFFYTLAFKLTLS